MLQRMLGSIFQVGCDYTQPKIQIKLIHDAVRDLETYNSNNLLSFISIHEYMAAPRDHRVSFGYGPPDH